jgi:hypothetical protein
LEIFSDELIEQICRARKDEDILRFGMSLTHFFATKVSDTSKYKLEEKERKKERKKERERERKKE